MADSKMFMMRIFLALSLSLAVCTNTAAAAAKTTSSSSVSRLRCAGGRSPSSSTVCLHKVSTQAYDGVLPLNDGSGRLLCWNRNGLIWLAAPLVGSVHRVAGGGKPLIDLGSRVRGRALAGVAVHYSTGRLFVSYYTTTVGPDGGSALFLVVDQLSSASSWSWSDDEANRPNPAQATTTIRVFSMALPHKSEPRSSSYYYGGQILFRPTTTDPFLYLVTGPAQSDGQQQAKILRFRVGQDKDMPMQSGANGTVTPMDAAQVYAAGLGIPRRCAFDDNRPQDLYCAIVKGDQELVYLTSDPDAPSYSATPPSPSLLVAHQRPTPGTPPSLVGGLLYRGYADSILTGSYIYMDGSEFCVTVASSASPARNHSATRNLRVTGSASATSPCRGGGDFAGGGVTSFGEDADKNALLLATDGVYLVVGPSLCDADTQAPTSIKKLLKWIFGLIGTLITCLSVGHVVYKKCSCFNRKKDININAPSGNVVNVFSGNNGIQLDVNN